MSNKLLLVIGISLLVLGIFRPNISSLINYSPNAVGYIETYVVDAPADSSLLEKAKAITTILQKSEDTTKRTDCLKLSTLYSDMATLIELDRDELVITNTATIREANSLCGSMLRLNIKDKYPNLAEASKDLVVSVIGDDEVSLDDELRTKAAKAFRALSWAFYEGSK